jgi:hypothetical protein
MSESDANNMLYIFYLSYDIPMTLSEIEQVHVNIPPNPIVEVLNEIQPLNEIPPLEEISLEETDEMPLLEEIPDNGAYLTNLINILINNIYIPPQPPSIDDMDDTHFDNINDIPLLNNLDEPPPLNEHPSLYIPLIFWFNNPSPFLITPTTMQDVVVTTDINSINENDIINENDEEIIKLQSLLSEYENIIGNNSKEPIFNFGGCIGYPRA